MRDTANTLVRVLLAPICPGCSAELEHPLDTRICDRCWAGIPQLPQPGCARCGDALGPGAMDPCCTRCRETPPPYEVARSAGRHDGSLRAIVHAFKYRRHRLLAEPLGQLMRERGRDLLDGADAVVPVPLHPIRSFKRGFNQADDLARQLGLPVWRALQ